MIKNLLCRYETLSSNPQNPHTSQTAKGTSINLHAHEVRQEAERGESQKLMGWLGWSTQQ